MAVLHSLGVLGAPLDAAHQHVAAQGLRLLALASDRHLDLPQRQQQGRHEGLPPFLFAEISTLQVEFLGGSVLLLLEVGGWGGAGTQGGGEGFSLLSCPPCDTD